MCVGVPSYKYSLTIPLVLHLISRKHWIELSNYSKIHIASDAARSAGRLALRAGLATLRHTDPPYSCRCDAHWCHEWQHAAAHGGRSSSVRLGGCVPDE